MRRITLKRRDGKEQAVYERCTTAECPILFKKYFSFDSGNIPSNNFECGHGWYNAIAHACRDLEELNKEYYPKYRLRIQADQIKQKFGTICFYWSIHRDSNKFLTYLSDMLDHTYTWMRRNIDFNYVQKCVKESREKTVTLMLDKAAYEKKVAGYKAANVELKEENGKYYEYTHLTEPAVFKSVPTKNILLWHISNTVKWLKYKAQCDILNKTQDKALQADLDFMTEQAEQIVEDLEEVCSMTCENCGRTLTQDNICKTTGYISYICLDCAERIGTKYVKMNDNDNSTQPVEDVKPKSKTASDIARELLTCKHNMTVLINNKYKCVLRPYYDDTIAQSQHILFRTFNKQECSPSYESYASADIINADELTDEQLAVTSKLKVMLNPDLLSVPYSASIEVYYYSGSIGIKTITDLKILDTDDSN